MGLFKKKEGGTLLGNLIRGVGDKFTGGMVSQLMPKPTALDFNSKGEFTGGILGGVFNKNKPDAPSLQPKSAIEVAKQMSLVPDPTGSNGGTPPAESGGIMEFLKKNAVAVVVGVLAIGGIIIAIVRKKKKKK